MAKPKSAGAGAERLIAVAREIIRETGDFDLPMRQLAARAQVSLRTPYDLFGSKVGVIRAILRNEHIIFRKLARETLPPADPLTSMFDRIELAISFYGREQPFYRALFRATQGYSGRTESARENLRAFTVLCRRARSAGYLREEIDPAAIAEVLAHIFAGSFRIWASGTFDIGLVCPTISYGFALVFAGTAPEPVSSEMRQRALAFQADVQHADAIMKAQMAAEPDIDGWPVP